MTNNIAAEITFTEEELQNARDALDYARNNAILLETNQKITKITRKINEAESKIRKEKSRTHSNHDCEKQGHDWGQMDVHEDAETPHLYKGCNACPKLKYRPIDEDTWTETEHWEEYIEQTGRKTHIRAKKQ